MNAVELVSVIIAIPEHTEARLKAAWHDLPRRTLEALAIQGYRDEVLSAGQVAELLELSLVETESFLKEKNVDLLCVLENLEQDRAAARQAKHKADAWISVHSRLPAKDCMALVAAGKQITIAYWSNGHWSTEREDSSFGIYHETITHWSPLPMPPKKDEAAKIRDSLRGREFSDSAELLREDRHR